MPGPTVTGFVEGAGDHIHLHVDTAGQLFQQVASAPPTVLGARTQIEPYSGSVSIFKFLTLAQIADVQNRTETLDLAAAINTALASGKNVYFPPGTYCHQSQLTIPNTATIKLSGEAGLSIIKAKAAFGTQLWRDGTDVGGANNNPTVIENLTFDAIKQVNICIRIGASKGGYFRNVRCKSFLTVGFQAGDDSASTAARFYENTIDAVTCDGDIGNVAAPPATGFLLTSNASDNVITSCTASYITIAGFDIFGGNNLVHSCHMYGQSTGLVGPSYGIRMNAPGRVSEPECDGVLIAGVDCNAQNISITGGIYYWSVTPTLWSSGAPVNGQGVAVQIESGMDTIAITGGTLRGDLASNPSVRWLAANKPQRLSVWNMSPPRRMAGDIGINTVERSLGVSMTSGNNSEISCNATSTFRASYFWYVNKLKRFEANTDASGESGSNVGSNWVFSSYADDGSTATQVMKYTRSTNALTLGSNATNLIGFYGGSGVAKPTVSGAKGSNAALGSLIAALVSQGLILDTTTA